MKLKNTSLKLVWISLSILLFSTNSFSTQANGESIIAKNSVEESFTLDDESQIPSRSPEDSFELYSKAQRKNSFEACADQFPGESPLSLGVVQSGMQPVALCSSRFAVVYSMTSKTPLVVVERLTSRQMRDAKGEERTDVFFADPRIPRWGRAELDDYKGQNPAVDRGHLAPAGNAPDALSMAQSFALSNIIPQDPTNNRKIWRKLESDVRKFATRSAGNVFVYTGPIFDAGHKTVGRNKVWKPTRIFKLVYDESSGRAWAYILPNAETRIERPMNYESFVLATGLKLLGGRRIVGSINDRGGI